MASGTRGSSLNAYLRVISGENSSWLGDFGRMLLSLLSFLYSQIMKLRNLAYDRGWFRSYALLYPVISVGNVTAGGTGKTPVVSFLTEWLLLGGLRPTILTRGYGAKMNLSKSHQVSDGQRLLLSQEEAGDEATYLALNLKNTSVWIGANRVQSGQLATKSSDTNIFILDDGFQHRRLRRNVDLVLLDALNPWGWGAVLPRGLLREPKGGITRADAILISRSNQVTSLQLKKLTDEISKIAPVLPIICLTHAPTKVCDLKGQEVISLESLREKRVCLFCGLGNPQGFFLTVAELGAQILDEVPFPDHYVYQEEDLLFLATKAKEQGAEVLLTTEKDGVKIFERDYGLPIWVLKIEIAFKNGEETLKNVIMEKCSIIN